METLLAESDQVVTLRKMVPVLRCGPWSRTNLMVLRDLSALGPLSRA